MRSYHGDHAAGPDVVAHAHHAHVVGVLAPPHEVLVAHVVGAVVHHEAASLHPAGVAPAQVGGHVWAVAHALIGTTLEVPLLVEDDLREREGKVLISTCEVYERHRSQVYLYFFRVKMLVNPALFGCRTMKDEASILLLSLFKSAVLNLH